LARPSKTIKTINSEKRSHLTKEQIAFRAEAEKIFSTDKPFIENSEVKKNKIAHKKFIELAEIFEEIKLSDALTGEPINLYCVLYSECVNLEKKIKDNQKRIRVIEKQYKNKEINVADYVELLSAIDKALFKYDSLLMSRRDMMIKIARESLMTVSSKLRAVPKNPPKDEELDKDPMNKFIVKRNGLDYG